MARTPSSERTLTLIRHAKAAEPRDNPDHDRELAPRGRKEARGVGTWLSQHAASSVSVGSASAASSGSVGSTDSVGSDPVGSDRAGSDPVGSDVVALELVLCSTSQRTRQTLAGICASGVFARQTRFDERIYDAGAASLLALLREIPDSVQAVTMIGHAPGVPALARGLARTDSGSTGLRERIAQGFPTAGLAILGFDGAWAALASQTAYLRAFVVPRG